MVYYQKNHWYKIFITFFSLMKKLWPLIALVVFQIPKYRLNMFFINLLLVLIFSIIKWHNTYIIITDNTLFYKEGAFIKEEMVIPLKNISLIELEKGWYHRLLNIRRFKIDSLSSAKDTEVVMLLKVRDLENLYNNLSEKMKNLVNKDNININEYLGYKISAVHLLLLSMLRSNIILGIGILYSSIHVMSRIYRGLDEELKNFFLKIIKEKVISRNTVLAIILSLFFIFAVMLLIVLVFSIFATLSKYYKFRIYRKDNYLVVEYGFLYRKSYSIPVENIHALKIEQNFINQMLKLYTIKCSVVGYGDSVREDELIFPLCNEKILYNIFNNIVPEFKFRGRIYCPSRKASRRFYTLPVMTTIFIAFIGYLIYSDLWVLFLSVPIVILNRTFLYKNSQLGFNDELYYISYRGFYRKRYFIRKVSVEEFRVTSNPLQLRKNLGNYNFKFYSQKKFNWIKVKNLDRSLYEKIRQDF